MPFSFWLIRFENVIEVKNISFSYPNSSSKVLKGISFKIEKGEIFGFLGPSGAGKSTTQKILYKILHGFTGEILIDKKPLQSWDKTYLEKIGVGFEFPNHYLKLTGRENLKLFRSFYNVKKLKPIPELFKMVGIEKAIDQPVEAYSKGMKMRLNFIRAIMHDPEILFFDEPTAGLDPGNAHKIKMYIKKLKEEGKTIFITTHNMNTADELCDRVSFIDEGVLQITDSPKTLKSKHGKHAVKVLLKNYLEKEFPIDNLGANSDFLAFIKSNEVEKIHTMEATLEEVFLKVTGKTLSK